MYAKEQLHRGMVARVLHRLSCTTQARAWSTWRAAARARGDFRRVLDRKRVYEALWLGHLAQHGAVDVTEGIVAATKQFLYQLGETGVVLDEPPRVWDMEALHTE